MRYALQSLKVGIHWNSWDDIQKVAKAGVARKYLKVGDLIETTYDGSPAVVEVVGINQDTPPGRDRKLWKM